MAFLQGLAAEAELFVKKGVSFCLLLLTWVCCQFSAISLSLSL